MDDVIFVSGATNSRMTTFLAREIEALLQSDKRVLVLEDVQELQPAKAVAARFPAPIKGNRKQRRAAAFRKRKYG